MRRIQILILSGVAATQLVRIGEAQACSPANCFGGQLVPENGATVPANLPGLRWYPMRGFGTQADPAKVTLTTTANPEVPIGLSQMADQLVPEQPLVAGTSYLLGDHNICRGAIGPSATFTVGPAAAVPVQLGSLRSTAHGVAKLEVDNDASCSTTIDAAQAAIDLDIDPAAAPWFAALSFETLVDDQIWHPQSSSLQNLTPGTSWRGRGTDLVYRGCSTPDRFVDPGLAAGKHTVVLRASIPGLFTVTSSSVEVDLGCAGDPSAGGCSASSSPSSSWLFAALLALVVCTRRRR